MIMPRKKRRMVKLIFIITILICVAITFFILYNTTDMFKSNRVLFEKYSKQLFNNIEAINNQEYVRELEEAVNNNKLESETIASIEYSADEDELDLINDIKVNISGQEDKSAKYNYKDVKITKDDEILMGAEYIEDETIVGFRLNEIRQFLSTDIEVENKNKIYNLYNLLNVDFKDLLWIGIEEYNILEEKYIGLMFENINSANYSKQSNVVVKVDGIQYDTNVYSLTIIKEQFNEIYIKILENLKKEEIILTKLETLDEKINQYYELIDSDEISDLKQEYLEYIENTIIKIQNFNIGTDERTISVYESNGVAISLSIDTEEEFCGIDVINQNGMNFINVLENEKKENGEQENIFDLKIKKTGSTNNEEFTIQHTINKDGVKILNNYSINRKRENDRISVIADLSRSIENTNVGIHLENITDIVDEFSEKQEIKENEDNIMLEKLDDEQISNVQNNVEQNIANQFDRLYQVISREDIKNILVKLDLIEDELDDLSTEGSITEVEKNRFNSIFELYEGENVTKEKIKDLITATKENLKDVRIIKYDEKKDEKIPQEYKMVIERGTNNMELAESVAEYIEENYSSDFSVKLEYDETTGLVNNIYISTMENS